MVPPKEGHTPIPVVKQFNPSSFVLSEEETRFTRRRQCSVAAAATVLAVVASAWSVEGIPILLALALLLLGLG